MDIADQSRRMSFFSKSKDQVTRLNNGLSEMSKISTFSGKIASAQNKAAKFFSKWGRDSCNSAIDDITQRTSDLIRLSSDSQLEFARNIDRYLNKLSAINEDQKKLDASKREIQQLEAKQTNLEKFLAKSISKNKPSKEILMIQHNLNKVKFQRVAKEKLLIDERSEAEVDKMIKFREAIIGIADSYRNLATDYQTIFGCQREIAEFFPQICTEDVTKLVYEGKPHTEERVAETRRSVESSHIARSSPASTMRRNKSEPSRRFFSGLRVNNDVPPPPYASPSAPPLEISIRQLRPKLHSFTGDRMKYSDDCFLTAKPNQEMLQNIQTSSRIYPSLD